MKKNDQEWLENREIILKGIGIAISQVNSGSLSVRDMAYGVTQSLLKYSVNDELYNKIFNLVSRMEIVDQGEESLVQRDFKELKEIVQNSLK